VENQTDSSQSRIFWGGSPNDCWHLNELIASISVSTSTSITVYGVVMLRQIQQPLGKLKYKSVWILVGINLCLGFIYLSAMVHISQGDWLGSQIRNLAETWRLKVPL
jgi:hypothetical protein